MNNVNEILRTFGDKNQPQTIFQAVDGYLQKQVGHKLLTYLLRDGQEVVRLYSSVPDAYPVDGRKPMGPTAWGQQVLERGEIFLGRDRAAMTWAFFDHDLLFSLGLGSVISVPVCYGGKVLGAISLCASEHYYAEEHVDAAVMAASLLVPAFLMATRHP